MTKSSQENVIDMTGCNLGKFLVVATFVARRLQLRKTPEILAAKFGNICRKGCLVLLQK